MKTIYIVEASPIDHKTGEKTIDFTPALAFGDQLVYLFPHSNRVNPALDPTTYIARARAGLSAFNDDDLLLASGHPVGVGICTAIAVHVNHGRVRMLIYHRKSAQYVPVMFDLSKK